jgi:pimeloyl-ACP methyl ester carboxylesterase
MNHKHHLHVLSPTPENQHYPLLIYFPGMDSTGELLTSQLPDLRKVFDVRCLQLPPSDRSDWQTLVDEVVGLLEKEKRSHPMRPIYLLGESFGGCWAVKVALAASGWFDRLILCNPASSFREQTLMAWGSCLLAWMPNFLQPVSAIALLPFLASLHRISPDNRQKLIRAMQSVPAETTSWRLSLLRDFDVTLEQLRSLRQPILAIASGSDRLLPSVQEVQRYIDNCPNAEMVVLPKSGHACLLETETNLYKIMKAHKFLPRMPVREQLSQRQAS